MIAAGKEIYIGDARGDILSLSPPYFCPRILHEAPGPVSAIIFHNTLYYGTWDGVIFTGSFSQKIGKNMIKSLAVLDDKLLASVDCKIVILSLDLEILEEYQTESKVYCIDVSEKTANFGMGSGLVSAYVGTYIPAIKSKHEATILCMRQGMSGSTDGKLMKGEEVLYSGNGWIRSLCDENLFSAGKSVIEKGREIYRHDDEVVGLLRIENTIISIGLDYCYKVYHREFILDDQEEEELLQMLNS
ncbi:hypothetical protein PAEPH01_0997 [Pancytospora epiphaga]|nr:hypothetical protein PAEPH01_0997 [Pancytospora epiphaga]